MAGLRTLLEIGGEVNKSINFDTLYVFNSNKTTASNGGACCLWTVPAGVSWFAVEMWGGGGGGGEACCCRAGWGGGGGSYARKFITGLSGDGGEEYTICAAGSTGCSRSTTGCSSFPSFVSINGGAVQICAAGGTAGTTRCDFQLNCSNSGCQHVQNSLTSFCGTMGIPGIYGGAKGSSHCSTQTWQTMNQAPFTMSNNGYSKDGCSGFCGGCCSGGYARWPGGGGPSAVSHTTGPFCGGPGAGGLVNIYYPIVQDI